jgi:hypothetical protein
VAHGGTLLDPTRQDRLRPLSADRPDVTESPYTVDAGHVQVEADLMSFARENRGARGRTDELRVAQMNVKLGLMDRADLQLVLVPYVKTTHYDVVTSGASGSSVRQTHTVSNDDLTLRLKLNLAGNDGGRTAVALLPFVSPPTAAGGAPGRTPAWGLAVPMAVELSERVGLGLMAQAAAQGDDRTYLFTASLAQSRGSAGSFVEIAAERIEPRAGAGVWATTLNTGLTYGVTPDLQLDTAVLFALDDEMPDWTLLTGVTVRR